MGMKTEEICATNRNKNVEVGNGYVIQGTHEQGGGEKNGGSGVRQRGDEESEVEMT